MINWRDPQARFALEAVFQAAVLAGQIQAKLVSKALTKDDRSPVTVADFAAQAVIAFALDQAFPGQTLVGEEQSQILRSPAGRDTLAKVAGFVSRVVPGAAPEQVCDLIDRGGDAPGEEYWTLDPIDGTKGFLRNAQYATALAYVAGDEVQLGVLGCPNYGPGLREASPRQGCILIARRGGGSWIARLDDFDQPDRFARLGVSDRRDSGEIRLLRSFEAGHTNPDLLDAFQRQMGGEADIVRMDSQVKYALLASGAGDIYLRLLSPGRMDYKEKVWDQAAGSLIVEEAGGKVTDLDGLPLDFSRGRDLQGNRGICASNRVIHDRALEALRAVGA